MIVLGDRIFLFGLRWANYIYHVVYESDGLTAGRRTMRDQASIFAAAFGW